jgi:hypothetical protein
VESSFAGDNLAAAGFRDLVDDADSDWANDEGG